MIAWLALVVSVVATLTSWLAYRRTVRAERAISWRVERHGRDHVLINGGPGTAEDVEVHLPEGNSATSWGELRRAVMRKDDVVRIGSWPPSSVNVLPDVIEVTWRVGRRRDSVSRQIL